MSRERDGSGFHVPREHGATLAGAGMLTLGPLCAHDVTLVGLVVSLGLALGLYAGLAWLDGRRHLGLVAAALVLVGPLVLWSLPGALPYAATAGALGVVPIALPADTRKRRLLPMVCAFAATALFLPVTYLAHHGLPVMAPTLATLAVCYLVLVLFSVRRQLGVVPDGGPHGTAMVWLAGIGLSALVGGLTVGAAQVCVALLPSFARLPAAKRGRASQTSPKRVGMLELAHLVVFCGVVAWLFR